MGNIHANRAPRASKLNILLIEDDLATMDHLNQGLTEKGHQVSLAVDGEKGLDLALNSNFDVLVVDRMLPHMDGVAVVKKLRDAGKDTPAIFLTTMSGLDDRVEGLDAGGDDYLVKPFAMMELVSRINALTRRTSAKTTQTTLRHGTIVMDLLKREVRRDDKLLELHPQEFKLLEYLIRSRGAVVTKKMLLEQVWGFDFDPMTTVVETHISRLRSKLDHNFAKPSIVTRRGVGYSLVA